MMPGLTISIPGFPPGIFEFCARARRIDAEGREIAFPDYLAFLSNITVAADAVTPVSFAPSDFNGALRIINMSGEQRLGFSLMVAGAETWESSQLSLAPGVATSEEHVPTGETKVRCEFSNGAVSTHTYDVAPLVETVVECKE
jgi:hypothetical protein